MRGSLMSKKEMSMQCKRTRNVSTTLAWHIHMYTMQTSFVFNKNRMGTFIDCRGGGATKRLGGANQIFINDVM